MSPQELQERIKQLEAENFQLKQAVEMQDNKHAISCMSLINSSEDVILAIDAVNFNILIYNSGMGEIPRL
ncbi:MAG TPA: hypothetical protein PK252_14520 [Bacteroidales bacterium]|nr:hypothetical protein [Bacteroidales bacterium]